MSTSDAGDQVLLAALQAAGDAAYRWDLLSDEIVWAGDLTHILAGDVSLVQSGEQFAERINDGDLPQRLRVLNQHLTDGHSFESEFRLRREDGAFAWVQERAAAELDEDGMPVAISGVLRVITRRKAREALLEHRANYDELTGHLNKSRLRESLGNTLAYCNRFKVPGALLAVGIDNFSGINDQYGRAVADEVVIGIGQRLERCLRIVDIVGRMDGDVFGVLLSNCDDKGVDVLCERVLEGLRNQPVDTSKGPVSLTASIGAVRFPEGIHTAQEAMGNAAAALRQAKEAGRNCARIFELSEEERLQRRRNREIGDNVIKALDEGRLILAYQPVVDSMTHQTRYYETLARMIDENGEIVAAGAFVPVAETLGLMWQLDRRALEIAVEDLIQHPDITLALNISSLTVTDQSWLRTLVSLVRGRPDLARRLIIEITETAALEDFDASARFVSSVRNLGCKVALDDFGSGYTSFKHMKSLTVDVVKIDGIFVRDVAQNPDNRLFVRTLMGLAEGFGLETVAECVENAEVAKILTEEGANYLQGWHFGKPDIEPYWRTAHPGMMRRRAAE